MRPLYVLLLSLLLQCQSSMAANRIDVRYNRTIETIMILRAISDSDYFLKHVPQDSKRRPMLYEARQFFKAYKNHPAVAETQAMLIEASDIGSTLSQGVLYAEELPGYKLKYEPVMPYWRKHKARLEAYMKVVAAFYKEANVPAFFKKHERFYNGAIAEARGYMNDKWVSESENYFKAHNDSYTVFIMPICPYGWGFSASLGKQQYAIVSPVGNSEWKPSEDQYTSFGFAGDAAPQHYQELVIHEFIHSFITGKLDEPVMRKSIGRFDSLYTPTLDSIMQQQGYAGWWSFVNEDLVRLAEVRIYMKIDPVIGQKTLQQQRKEYKFILLADQQPIIAKYETQHSKYKNFHAFLPELIDGFSRFSRSDVDRLLAESNASK